MPGEYDKPSDPILIYRPDGVYDIHIPPWNRRKMADRRFFSINNGTLIRLDIDEDMPNNCRIVLTDLAKLLGFSSTSIRRMKKPELATHVQSRFKFID
jgi:hypothetical protein